MSVPGGSAATPSDDGSVPYATQLPSNVLYDDKYVQVTDTHLIIKVYYFPFGSSKKILFGNIEQLFTDREYGVTPLGYKNWGMGMSDIWWAWGGFPREQNNFVVKVHDAWPSCGFSVENPRQFREALTSKGVKGAVGNDL